MMNQLFGNSLLFGGNAPLLNLTTGAFEGSTREDVNA